MLKRFQLCLLLLAGVAWCGAVAVQASSLPATYTRVEEATGWSTCGNCGNTGGNGQTASYSMTRGIPSPSLDGSSSKFSISGPAFTNGYWYLNHSAPSTALSYLRYEFEIYIPSGYQNAPQAIEFECQHRLNGWVYNFAFQANYAANQWRTFNYVNSTWENVGLPLTRFAPGTWHHVIAYFHEYTAKHLVYHDGLTIDGVAHPLSFTTPAKYTGNTWDRFTNAFQLDLNASGTPYHVYLDNMTIAMQ
jgi:hypothetical protein